MNYRDDDKVRKLTSIFLCIFLFTLTCYFASLTYEHVTMNLNEKAEVITSVTNPTEYTTKIVMFNPNTKMFYSYEYNSRENEANYQQARISMKTAQSNSTGNSKSKLSELQDIARNGPFGQTGD